MDSQAMAGAAADELRAAAAGVEPAALAAMVTALCDARRVVCHGVGREGLMMRALAMRLYHMGLDAHVAGDMSCPPVGAGDLLIVAAGPGDLPSVEALARRAAGDGARIACVTAQPQGPVPKASDLLLVIPAQTMADDRAGGASVLPMGSVFEGAMFVVFEVLVLMLRDRLGITAEAMRARHTNLE